RLDPGVSAVEQNAVRPLAAGPFADRAADRMLSSAPRTGGAGVVIGVVDTGLAPESPLFAQVRRGGSDGNFSGSCVTGQGWDATDCTNKVVGARWFVSGFGEAAVRATSALSPRDTDGHGTQMASIAAGNAEVPVRVAGERLGRFGGMAPQAKLAIYKACWSAPDPDDDGCATADLVTAIDQATRDGVDVLSLSVGGPAELDIVELALLGAVEDGIVVAAAAGNAGPDVAAAHPSPWVTTVGGLTGEPRRGAVVLPSGRRLAGAMLSRRGLSARRAVLASNAAATDALRRDARVCAPGGLDAARVAGAIVICERGRVGRVDKSEAVALADGAGMVLVNVRRNTVDADVHRVPTIHLAAGPGRRLVRWATTHPEGRLRLRPTDDRAGRVRVARFSGAGDIASGLLKPDVVAPATGVLGGVPGGQGNGWDFVTGTSAATAYTAGVAATLLAADGRSAAEVRSALVTTADPVRGTPALLSGSGQVRPRTAAAPGLAYVVDPRDYRAWLEGRRTTINTPSIVLSGGLVSASRTITSMSRRTTTFIASTTGFRTPVRLSATSATLAPGEALRFTLSIDAPDVGRLDEGSIVWRGSDGSVTRIPVVIAR
ncbi:MAG: S8 family serine peptidase, partial [Nocardioides sp.]